MHNLKNKKNSKVEAATLPLLLLIVTSPTLPLMLFPAPLAAANEEACNASGGAWVQVGNNGFCLRNLEPDTCALESIPEPPDPDLKPQTGLCVTGSIIVPGTTSTTCAPTVEGGTNSTTAEGVGGGNQSTTSEVEMLIEEACMALQNNDTQGALMQLNSALGELSSNVTTTTTAGGGGNATNATTAANQTADIAIGDRGVKVVEVQGTPGETIEDVQQRMVEEINGDPTLTPEQKTQAINQLSAEVAQQQPQIERAEDPCADESNWVIVITYKTPPPHEIEIQCDGRTIADIAPSDETGEEGEAAPQTTTEQGDPVPGLDVEEGAAGEGNPDPLDADAVEETTQGGG